MSTREIVLDKTRHRFKEIGGGKKIKHLLFFFFEISFRNN